VAYVRIVLLYYRVEGSRKEKGTDDLGRSPKCLAHISLMSPPPPPLPDMIRTYPSKNSGIQTLQKFTSNPVQQWESVLTNVLAFWHIKSKKNTSNIIIKFAAGPHSFKGPFHEIC
jgi:hypothetical protein